MTVAPRHASVLALQLLTLLCIGGSGVARAAESQPTPPLMIHRAAGPIAIDGVLTDAGWQGVEPITTWFETRVGDNVEPQVANAAYLTYDERYFYAGFRFDDPDPAAIRAPLGDHDAVNGSMDYAGVIVDSHHDGKTAQVFLSNPRGVQYDAVTSDATGEDGSPDFLWDAAGRMTATGWSLEIRIPFSSLRYANESDPTWGILLYRNYPRDRPYQFYSARLPREVSCLICNSSLLVGLASLPHGSHLVAAPFATAQQTSVPRAALGTPLASGAAKIENGLDLKWSPAPNAAIDLTANPDFSQIESDVAQVTANERSALFYPEKRAFFLEGVDLLSTPMPVVYTRTITSPDAGLRATGKAGATAYTALVTRDRGGGEVILPGPQGSSFADQDFRSYASVLRVRHDLGGSFVSVLAAGRGLEHGGGNIVIGPDFQWRPSGSDACTGQALWSRSRTPDRPDLAAEWDGRTLSDHAYLLGGSHNTERVDVNLQGMDVGPEFRADDGFIPQVGYREAYLNAGYAIRPSQAFLSRLRAFTEDYYDAETGGRSLNQHLSLGSEMDGRWNSSCRAELIVENVRVGDAWLHRFRPHVLVLVSPGRVLNQLSIETNFGQEIDFDNAREGDGLNVVASVTVRPNAHLELKGNADRRTLNVDVSGATSRRVFTAQVERLRATWSFTSRAFVRLIGQYVETRNDTSLYTFPVAPREAYFNASALFAYKLSWQTVFYAGYGDTRTYLDRRNRLVPGEGEVFAKVSYAVQH